MSRFVRASKFRHVYGQPVKRDKYYDNIRLSKNSWDSNFIKANPKYLSVNWDASGGGAFAVVPLAEAGKLPEILPLFRGHTGPVLDTDWNPFDDDVVASGSEDGTVGIYHVPKGFSTRIEKDENDKDKDITPVDVLPKTRLKGHSKKVGVVRWHPTASNILVSGSADHTVKVWNIESEQCLATLIHTDIITSLSFNENGSKLATITRDKIIRVWDIRENKVLTESKAHNGAKSQRVVWLGAANRVATTGFDRSDRQYALWNTDDLSKGPIGGFQLNGSSSGICMPFFDEGTNILYLIGKGDGNIQYLEFADDQLFPLSEYQSTEPQRGVAVLPRRALAVREHEIFRIYKSINDTSVEPIQFFVPRKAETFQDDVYPDALAGEAALSGEEWWSGKDSNPKVISLAAVFEGEEAQAFTSSSKPAAVSAPAPKKEEPTPKSLEPKTETKEAKPESRPEPKRAVFEEKKNIDNVLANSSEVNKLLAKANDSVDEEPRQNKEKSTWESDDDEPIIERVTSRQSSKQATPASSKAVSAHASPATSKPISRTTTIKNEDINAGSESEQEQLTTPSAKATPKQSISAASEVHPASHATVDAVSKLTDLLYKLHAKVEALEGKIDDLHKKVN